MRGRAAIAPAVAVGLAAVAAAGAAAQYALPVTKLTGSVAPSAGGSAGRPVSAAVRAAFTVDRTSRASADRITLLLPAGIRLSGRGFPACPAARIAARGRSSCPRGSRIGAGAGRAVVGPEEAAADFSVAAYAAGERRLALALRGAVSGVLTGAIGRAASPFGQRIAIAVPPAVRQPEPGVHARVTALSLRLGPASRRVVRRVGGVRRRQVVRFAALTGCPADRAHRFGVRLRFAPAPGAPRQDGDEARDTAPCRP